MVAILTVVLCGLEWFRYLTRIPPSPWAHTVITVLVLIWAFFRFRQRVAVVKSINQGIDGEVYVGHSLEALRSMGFRVLHDIPADGWNIDHVLIGPRGIFAIETKTPSKGSGQAQIDYDGKRVLVEGRVPDRDPIVQAEAAARWLREFIVRTTDRPAAVRSVVIYPNWYVSRQPKGAKVWVLNEKALPSFLEKEPESIPPQHVAEIHDCLVRYVRGKERV